jgi:hypothetical protein
VEKKEKTRKPYAPPRIRTERVYERRSLACGKVQPPFGQRPPASCIGNFRNS